MIGNRGKKNLFELNFCNFSYSYSKNITIMIHWLQTVVYIVVGDIVLLVILLEAFWLHRCSRRMLDTKCVGDKFEMLATDSGSWEPI